VTQAPRRGRPARFSRDQIVAAVADMLVADPSTPLTIARAAEAVGAKPMSLYRHFSDRDDLIAAVAQHLFAGIRPRIARGAGWQAEVRAWMTAIYRQARKVPQIVQLLASGESAEWLGDSAYLARVFERAGFHDDRLLAEAVYWVATATMGHAMIDAAGSGQFQTERLRARLDHLDEDDAALNARLIPELEKLHAHAFELVIDLTIAGLEKLLAPYGR
jgi:AcrR family transcriptional regulator